MRIGLDTRLLGKAGIGRFVQGLWGGLVELGVDVVGLGAPASSEWLGDAALAPVSEPVPLSARPHRLREQAALPRALKRERIDVYHSPHLTVPYLTRTPIVITVHDLFPLRPQSNARSRPAAAYMRVVLPAAIRRADAIVAVAISTAEELQQRFPETAAKVSVVEHGIDTRLWAPSPAVEIERVRSRYRLPGRYFLYVGTAKVHKNLETLLEAHDQATMPDLVIAGASRAEVGDGAPAGVRVLGRVPDDDLPPLYSGATAVVQPSRAEAVGFTALEAMACGTALVASATGGLEHTVKDAAVLVDPTDVAGWRRALRTIAEDERLRASLVEAGSRRVSGRRWIDAARRYAEIYERVAGIRR